MKATLFIAAVVVLCTVFAAAQVPLVDEALNPASRAPGSPAFSLTVYGSGFTSAAVVKWNGSPRLTEVISTHELIATIQASDVLVGQTASITVANQGSGGGTSNVVYFPVTVKSVAVGMSGTAVLSTTQRWQVVGDFNGDGSLDVAWPDDKYTLKVSLGNGDGTFKPAISSGTLFVPLAQGDFNNDGKLDLLGWNDTGVAIMLGNGDGTFKLKSTVPNYGSPIVAAVADFSQDGNLDVVVTGDETNEWGFDVCLGKGDGTFSSCSNYGGNENYASVTVGDFNGDGLVDVAVVGYSNAWLLYVYLGNGDGSFQTPLTIWVDGPVSIAAADMNHDGKLDLVTSDVCILLGNGDGTFVQSACNFASGGPSIGDFNGDGNLDVVSSPVDVLLGAGNGQFLSTFDFRLGYFSGVGSVGDFNNDGHLDLFYGSGEMVYQIPINLSPSSLSFANQKVGTVSSPKAATLINVGWSALSLSNIRISGTDASQFTETNNCGTKLAAKASCKISVSFAPTQAGSLTGSLTLNYTGLGSPQTVALSGTGVEPTTVTLLPSSLKFAMQIVGTTSPAQTATLTNTGPQSIKIHSIATNGAFSQTNNCPTTLWGDQSCQIQVVFTPTAVGTSNGTLSVADDGANSPQRVALTGTGTVITLSPLGINFGDQKVGTTSPSVPITVTNSGANPVSVMQIAITGTNVGDFAETNNCGNNIAAHGSCSITVTFSPTAAGLRSASVSVTDNGGGSPQTASLTGTGT
jgi:FG-GAP-like repeat/Abnormal spindle-like microcephaly-assoc'd, ASPM-SPD-2-Hydin